MFGDLAISGIPLIFIVFGLVECFKKAGLQGTVLTWISLGLGLILYFLYAWASAGLPVDPMGWLSVIITGIAFGLTASGIYDFIKARSNQ